MAKQLYEAMFMVDSATGEDGFPGIVRHIAGLIRRYEGKIERIEKWSEREPAYPVKNVKHGIYILVFFEADAEKVSGMRQAMNLSEQISRFIILAAGGLSPVSGALYDEDGEEKEVPAAADSSSGDEESDESDNGVAEETSDADSA